jgi:hypothetical protein
MDDYQPASEVQSPIQRIFVIASIGCFASLLIVYWIARPAVELLEDVWIETLVYAIVPLCMTFVVLYHSCWHPEIAGAARTGILLFVSLVILFGVLFAIGVGLCMIWFCINAVTGGPGPG